MPSIAGGELPLWAKIAVAIFIPTALYWYIKNIFFNDKD
jgi:hypothetical protein